MSHAQLHLGLLGLGSRSTQFYLGLLNARYNALRGDFATCPLVMLNADFGRINPFLPDDFEKLDPVILEYLSKVVDLSIQRLIIPNITLHAAVDRVLPMVNSPLEVVHPAHVAIRALQEMGVRESLLLGTRHTATSSYLPALFASAGITLYAPDAKIAARADRLRLSVCDGAEEETDVEWFNAAVTGLGAGMQVVVSCTELSLTLREPLAETVTDMARLQVEEALRLL